MRVLVTASRSWPEDRSFIIYDSLDRYVDVAESKRDRLTVVHGGARGGDHMAHAWTWNAVRAGRPVNPPEVHRADWSGPCRDTCPPGHRRRDTPSPHSKRAAGNWTVCPMAGFYRNEYMVSLGADVCLAFIHNGSRGATQCSLAAKDAGVEVVAFYL
jgi:hypothetical protein